MVFKKKIFRKKRISQKPRRKTVAKRGKFITKTQLYRAIRRNIETKIVSTQYGLTSFNSSIGATTDLIKCLPDIIQGSGQNNRIGHEIRPLKLVIRGYVAFNTDSVGGSTYQDAVQLGGRLFCFQDKANRCYTQAIVNYNLLDAGGTSAQFAGTAMNFVVPHNSDQFMFFADKRMRIQKPFGWTNNVSPSSTNAITSMNPSLFHPFTITFTQKQLPAVFKYDETMSSSFPVNFAPYIALGYADLLNKSPDVSTVRLNMEFCSTLYYEDA